MNIVVTGAAKGIGYEIVQQFDALGTHQVIAISRDERKLNQLNSSTSSATKVLTVDLTSNKLKKVCEIAFAEVSQVDILINNAGQLINKSFLKTTASEFIQQYESNVISAVNIVQCLYSKLLKSERAHVVNITSMGGLQGSSKFSGLSAYSTSKGALSTLSECLAEEFKEDSIFVNALALGAVKTEMLKNAFPSLEIGMEANEMAKFIVNFALTAHHFINGKIIPVSLSTP